MTPEIARAIVTVGDGGRGFVVAGEWTKVVITSAHCLAHLPPAHGAAHLEEKTYANLLGRLEETPTVWVECLFADPVSDIAVLGSPDNQALENEADAYEELLEPIKPLAISDTKEKGRAWLFSLERQWLPCTYEVFNDGPLWLSSKEKVPWRHVRRIDSNERTPELGSVVGGKEIRCLSEKDTMVSVLKNEREKSERSFGTGAAAVCKTRARGPEPVVE